MILLIPKNTKSKTNIKLFEEKSNIILRYRRGTLGSRSYYWTFLGLKAEE